MSATSALLRRLLPRTTSISHQCRRYSINAATSAGSSIRPKREYSTPLAEQLTQAIQTTGPIPLAFYMKQCLTSPASGYYTTQKSADIDPFGKRGDFITSPEISQMFGEMVGLWIFTEWMRPQRKRDRVQIIELGPGRGTLMSDILRTLRRFKSFSDTVESIYMIEASPHLQEAQKNLLCPSDAEIIEVGNNGLRCMSKYGIPITWFTDLEDVPATDEKSPYIIAHEFFDALPIHAFQATENGWREFMVANKDPATIITSGTGKAKAVDDEFTLALSKARTPHSMVLPELSSRYRKLSTHPGSIIEVSPESLAIMETIAKRIGMASSGAALIIDYGPSETIPVNSLRGIRQHKIVSPFSKPGETDISADVDFMALADRAINAHEGVEVHGPVEQGAFLKMMGMKERLDSLIKGRNGEDETVKGLVRGYNRLVETGGGGMGRIYKALAVVPERGGKAPVGFGGSVE
ncbi:DUF185-domain-containing protein [Ascodesmis nigricans]|uniref:Protein arginine methyltransferase NDUFAF7 n=1 Tax=Ascodesmis nigricans TaxID=341454 RepID=A0A4S2N635_9PEZI|nr:DUF185-domain-containing protein [Ascodesmis nigricans]